MECNKSCAQRLYERVRRQQHTFFRRTVEEPPLPSVILTKRRNSLVHILTFVLCLTIVIVFTQFLDKYDPKALSGSSVRHPFRVNGTCGCLAAELLREASKILDIIDFVLLSGYINISKNLDNTYYLDATISSCSYVAFVISS